MQSNTGNVNGQQDADESGSFQLNMKVAQIHACEGPQELGTGSPPKRRSVSGAQRVSAGTSIDLPMLMTAEEVASLLRTTRMAIYAMAARAQIPGITRVGRRLLFRSADLLQWLGQNSTPSPKG